MGIPHIFKRFISRKKDKTDQDRQAEREALFLKAKEILVKELKIDDPQKLTPASNLEQDFGVDSLESINLIMAFEEEFNIEIPDDEAEKLLIVKEIIDYLEKKIADNG